MAYRDVIEIMQYVLIGSVILGVWYFVKALVYNEADDKYMTFLIVGWFFFFAIIYKNLIL